MRESVETATAELTKANDAAAVKLALTYATAIDAGVEPAELAKIGGELLKTLAELGLTPKARAAIVKGGAADDGPVDPLDELQARRAARLDNAAAVDSPAP